jgi:hypothetical protein
VEDVSSVAKCKYKLIVVRSWEDTIMMVILVDIELARKVINWSGIVGSRWESAPKDYINVMPD